MFATSRVGVSKIAANHVKGLFFESKDDAFLEKTKRAIIIYYMKL